MASEDEGTKKDPQQPAEGEQQTTEGASAQGDGDQGEQGSKDAAESEK